MTKQEKAVLNMAKFLQSQSLLLLEKLNELDSDNLDAETYKCAIYDSVHWQYRRNFDLIERLKMKMGVKNAHNEY